MTPAPEDSKPGTDADSRGPARRVLARLAVGAALALSLGALSLVLVSHVPVSHVAVSLTSPPSATTPVQPIRDTIHGQHVGILIPSRPNGVLVIAVHGHGGTVNSWLLGALQASVRAALLRAGYSLAASDGAGNGWGNAQSVTAYTDLYAWAQQKASFSRVALIGESMGGLASLQLATRLPAVAAWVGIYPVCNLATMTARYPDTARAWPDGTTGRLSPVDLGKTRGLKMIFFASPGDTVVRKASNTDLCAARAAAAGASAQVVQVTGQHGDKSTFQPARVVSFLDAATGNQRGS
jgi:pimeloyl-ACP methyl ester carboxylesterase